MTEEKDTAELTKLGFNTKDEPDREFAIMLLEQWRIAANAADQSYNYQSATDAAHAMREDLLTELLELMGIAP